VGAPPVYEWPALIRYTIKAVTWASMEHLTWFSYVERGEEVELVYSGAYELRKLTIDWTRQFGTDPPQDVAQCTFHLLNLTAGVPDASWITSDYTTAEALFDTWWTAIKIYYADEMKTSQYSWRADGPAFRPHGTEFSPTLRTVSRSSAGTNTTEQTLPPQTAVSVTEVTPAKFTVEDVEGVGTQLRNRWGRFYLPPPVASVLNAGRLEASIGGTFATATQTLYNGLVAAQLVPVMYSPTTGNSWAVTEIHVDDIFDVIRSRRFTTPKTRNTKTINAV